MGVAVSVAVGLYVVHLLHLQQLHMGVAVCVAVIVALSDAP